MLDLDERLDLVVAGRLATPFNVLGNHPLEGGGRGRVVRAFLPWATAAAVTYARGTMPMELVHPGRVFEAIFPDEPDFFEYRLSAEGPNGTVEVEDPYRFPLLLSDEELRRIRDPAGRVHQVLGAHLTVHEGVSGARFAVWAPEAAAVCVIGEFNGWQGWLHPMRSRGASGVWELFLPGVDAGGLYKYRIRTRSGGTVDKADPCGRATELRPGNASRIRAPSRFSWTDGGWLAQRPAWSPERSAMSVYEVHLGSWRRHPGARPREGSPGWLDYRELAEELLPYVRDLGFTHVELLPITEHPLDRSWGYQTTGYFAPTSRHGDPDDFRHFMDRAHALGLGVILDWVPAHFPRDQAGLGKFDGTHLYEHADPRQGFHPDWETYLFNLGRPEVVSFLVSSALHWIEEYHIDGLRLDAVASMLYLDYSRDEGGWVPNVHGGNENLESISFLRTLNAAVREAHPGVVVVAEESTAWPRVTHDLSEGGLGFHAKWNMGWMHDTLEVMETDPLFRSRLFEKLTFSILYAFSERFILPFSHDEVVHMKGSMLEKMPGSEDERFAHLRALYGYMWAHPGKKLLFMGGELGVWREWDFEGTLDWSLLDLPAHRGLHAWVRALNRIYGAEPALHATDWDGRGFEWIDCHDRERTVLSFIRWAGEWTDPVVVVVNLTPVAWKEYRLAVPFPGTYRVVLNGDDPEFGGSGVLTEDSWVASPGELHGRDQTITLTVPPLAALFLKPEQPSTPTAD